MQTPTLLFKLNLYQHGLHQPNLDELRRLLFSADTADAPILPLAEQAQPESLCAILDMSLAGLLPLGPFEPPPTLLLGGDDDALIPRHDVEATARRYGSQA
ncbi:hypothetical protein OL229_01820 [Neisseriaceae bacterium JH1-16]|nr:hypothetical protein [Neisseriaceae bacterium JH1-16]